MSLTSSGIICDICGKFILLEPYDDFTLVGHKNKFHCHTEKCSKILFNAAENNDYKLLPVNSPIRKAFDKIKLKENEKMLEEIELFCHGCSEIMEIEEQDGNLVATCECGIEITVRKKE